MRAFVAKQVSLGKLKPAPYNPKGRMERKKLGPLMRSMAKFGLLSPILIDEKYNIIEGHRRWQAAKELAWPTVECRVVHAENAEARDALYASGNSTPKRHNGNDLLYIWLERPEAVSQLVRKRMEDAAEVLTVALMQRICRKGLSLLVYRFAVELAKEVEKFEPATVRKIVEWMLRHDGAPAVRRVVNYDHDRNEAEKVYRAVERDKPIKLGVVA